MIVILLLTVMRTLRWEEISRDIINATKYYFIRAVTTAKNRLSRMENGGVFVCVFDNGKQTWRKQASSEYKGQRKKGGSEMWEAGNGINSPDFLEPLGIYAYTAPVGLEADDAIAGMAVANAQRDCVIVSSDKDFYQLLRHDHIQFYNLMINEYVTCESVKKKHGVPPELFDILLGIAGDVGDNVPGIPGVGEKTVGSIIQRSGAVQQGDITIADIVNNTDNVLEGINPKYRELIEKHKEDGEMSHNLVYLPCPINEFNGKALDEVSKFDVDEAAYALESAKFDETLQHDLNYELEWYATHYSDEALMLKYQCVSGREQPKYRFSKRSEYMLELRKMRARIDAIQTREEKRAAAKEAEEEERRRSEVFYYPLQLANVLFTLFRGTKEASSSA